MHNIPIRPFLKVWSLLEAAYDGRSEHDSGIGVHLSPEELIDDFETEKPLKSCARASKIITDTITEFLYDHPSAAVWITAQCGRYSSHSMQRLPMPHRPAFRLTVTRNIPDGAP